MICIFGLFHGLILLPVVLAILGPVEEENKKVRGESWRGIRIHNHLKKAKTFTN